MHKATRAKDEKLTTVSAAAIVVLVRQFILSSYPKTAGGEHFRRVTKKPVNNTEVDPNQTDKGKNKQQHQQQ